MGLWDFIHPRTFLKTKKAHFLDVKFFFEFLSNNFLFKLVIFGLEID